MIKQQMMMIMRRAVLPIDGAREEPRTDPVSGGRRRAFPRTLIDMLRRPRGNRRRVFAIAVGLTLVISLLNLRQPNLGKPLGVRVGEETPVTAMNLGTANNSPILASDPTEPRFVASANRIDAPDFGCTLQVSGDGGRSWVPANPVVELPPRVEKCYGPEVGFDRNGVLYFLFVGLAGTGNEPVGAFLTSSSDRANSFTAPRQILGPLNFAVRMAIDPSHGERGRIHLVWLHATSDPPLGGFPEPPNPILAAYSDDGGSTFSNPVQVSDPKRDRVVAPAAALGPDGSVYVAYYDLKDDARDYHNLEGPVWEGTWAMLLASSHDDGITFGKSQIVSDEIQPPERPMLIFTMPPPALVAGRGGVCVAWTDARHGDADALMACESEPAGEWSEVRLNDDGEGNGARQYLPRLSLSPQGRIDAVFYDRRDDPENIRNHVYYTYSVDGGRNTAPNVRLTSAQSDSRIGPQYVGPAAEGQHEIGSRLGLLSGRNGALVAWVDTRHSRALSSGQEVVAVDVQIAERSQTAILERVGFGVTGLLVVGLGAWLFRTGHSTGRFRWRVACDREASKTDR